MKRCAIYLRQLSSLGVSIERRTFVRCDYVVEIKFPTFIGPSGALNFTGARQRYVINLPRVVT